jgi:hypothetical protein
MRVMITRESLRVLTDQDYSLGRGVVMGDFARSCRPRNQLVSTYTGHSSWVLGLAASPDLRHFASRWEG